MVVSTTMNEITRASAKLSDIIGPALRVDLTATVLQVWWKQPPRLTSGLNSNRDRSTSVNVFLSFHHLDGLRMGELA